MMNSRFLRHIGVVGILITIIFPVPVCAQSVTVKVYEDVAPDRTIYHYDVINKSDQPITTLKIGIAPDGSAQLNTLPAGWSFEKGIPAGNIGAPKGWKGRIITTEEEEGIYIDWRNEAGTANDIAPNSVSRGFFIALPVRAQEYTTSFYDAVLGNSSHVRDKLQAAANAERER